MTLWGGRFDEQLDPDAWKLNTSIDIDRRLADQDVRGSLTWAKAIFNIGVLTESECSQICEGLEAIQAEFTSEEFVYLEGDEDIHSAVERRLGEMIGPLAGKLHTGRSRNDQVATDSRLWLLDHLPKVEAALAGLQVALVWRAEIDLGIMMPGYTHLQRAQPILLSHWWLSHFWPLQRDRKRLEELKARTASLPLGSAALAGASFPIDRAAMALDLGFASPSANSIDAVSDRDFIAEFLFCVAMTGVHLSRFAEAIILFNSAEFGFLELSDAYSTGSSLMPQKKNPDVFELARGKSGTLTGLLTGFLGTLKGLPSTYDKDLQEDKSAMFASYDNLVSTLPVLAAAIRTLDINPERMQAAIDPASMATDLADDLVRKGVPFREAHSLVGQAVGLASRSGKSLVALSRKELSSISPALDVDLSAVLDPRQSIARHSCIGGTALESVQTQIESAYQVMSEE